MATIVQPYNPWKEQLALTALGNVAGNILNDLWQSHRQNERNRKANAFRGQLQQNLQNAAQPEISLMPKEAPQGYNSNPWANAMHQNYTPLTAFDIGTSQRQPSIQDIVQGADSLAASKRFSMLSPELVQGVKNSMIQQAENQRLKDLQNNFADMFGNAKSPTEQMRALILANLYGFGDKAMAPFGSFAAHMSPHKQAIETDTGNTKRIDAFDPLTGNITPGAAYNVTVSPNTAATVAGSQNVAKINAGSAENVARIHALGDEARAQATVQAQQLKIWQEQHKALSEEIANDRANLAGLNEQEAIAMQSIINQKEQRLAQLEMLMSSAYSGTGSSQATQGTTARNPANSNNVWFGMVGNPEGISIHPHGTFGYDRGDHKHGGIDIRGVSEGTDIRAMPQMGSSFIVRQAYKSDSYGNNIVIESDRKFNGKSIKFRIAHMQDGSLNLKPGQTIKAGDIIGKVGSTGRSTGPHIHLEVMVDGHLVDPQNFFQQFPLDNTAQATATQSSPPQPQTEATATQTQQQTTTQPTTQGQPYLRNSETGQTLSLQEFEELRDINHTSANDLFDALTDRGWKIDNGQQNTPQLPITALNDTQNVTTQPQTSTNSEPVQRTNRPFSLPGQPNFPKAYDVHDVIGAINSIKNTENPFSRPNVQDWHEPLNPAPVQPVSADANPWSYVQQNTSPAWGSFDIHQPILGGQRQQPLPQQQTLSNDSRLSPLFSGNAINAAPDFLKGLNLTSGDETAITPKRINPIIIDYSFDPRYSDKERSSWQNGAGYDAQQILGWINSSQHNENPYWGHSQPSQSPQKLPIKGNPVNTGANPWSYVRENTPSSFSPNIPHIPHFNAITSEDLNYPLSGNWEDYSPLLSALNGNDVIPLSVLYSDPFYYLKNFILGNRR